ncbi:hypothetical protein M441DRAFT_140884, partial [Trichoderma asperellum CBS 433.97]
YQNYYTEHFQFDPSRTAILGGIQTFLLLFSGDAAGPLYDAGYTRLLAGTIMQRLCIEYWQFVLAKSFCIGFGGGLISFLTLNVCGSICSLRKKIANADFGFCIIVIINIASALGCILLSSISLCISFLIYAYPLSSTLTLIFALDFDGARNVASFIVSGIYRGNTSLFFVPQPIVLIELCPILSLSGRVL